MFEDGVDAATQSRAVAHRGNAACNLDPVDQHHRCIMHRRIHGVGATCRETLAIDPQQDALAKQPAHLHLARKRAIRDDSRAGLTSDKGRAIGSGGQFLVSFGRGIGGRQARRCNDDGVS